MREIETVYEKVERILFENPNTRNSDAELYLAICAEINPDALNRPFKEVFLHLNDYGLPNTETVRRSRQKAQAKNIALRATKSVDDARFENFKYMREWAHE